MSKLRIFLTIFIVLLLSGCATMSEERKACIWLTSFGGFGAAGAVAGLPGAGGGLAGGALLGTLICPDGTSPPPAAAEESGYFWPDDQDRDGIVDRDDACPFTPEGVAIDSRGCALDGDGDGVPDYLDQCPNTPLGAVVDTTGCSRTLLTLQDVHFAFDSAQLTGDAKSILDRAVSTINANPSNNLSVEGHTDSTGSDNYNANLSKRRAQSVMNYLVSKGVSASRLTAVGKGESHPVASNDTREGRRQNRRVNIIAR